MAITLFRPSRGSITSGYGPRTGGVGSTNHKGIDFSWMRPDRVQDWNIYAAASGTVVFAGYYGGWGNLIRIRHGLGYETWYAHQSAFRVHKGQTVTAGQVIGVIGNTGTSAGAHLHFELRLFGVPINPTNKFTSTAGGDIEVIEETETTEQDTDMKLAIIKYQNGSFHPFLIVAGRYTELGRATLAAWRGGKAKHQGPLGREFEWSGTDWMRVRSSMTAAEPASDVTASGLTAMEVAEALADDFAAIPTGVADELDQRQRDRLN